MAIVIMDLRPAASPTPSEVWSYSWLITFTWRSALEAPTQESRDTAGDPDELADIIRRRALDPRIISYRYERQERLDMSAAPRACFGCGDPYALVEPRRWWQPCACGGHHIYRCASCDHEQLYPTTVATCVRQARPTAGLAAQRSGALPGGSDGRAPGGPGQK